MTDHAEALAKARAARDAVYPLDGTEAAITAYLAALQPAEPVAWVFELAKARNMTTGEYVNWGEPRLSFDKPCVPEGSIRNLRPLYATPALAGTEPAGEVVVTDEMVEKALAVLDHSFQTEAWERAGPPLHAVRAALAAALRDQSEA